MATRGYTRRLGLSLDQHRAIDLFLVGQNDTQVATSLNLHRVTVTRWRLYDHLFRSELNRRRKEYWAGASDAMRSILPNAFESVREQLRIAPSRGRLALDIITRAGVMGKPYSGALASADVGPDTPEGVLDEEVLRFRAARRHPDTEIDDSPITDAERAAALDRLQAFLDAPLPDATVPPIANNQAAPEVRQPGALDGGTSVPADTPTLSASTRTMRSFS